MAAGGRPTHTVNKFGTVLTPKEMFRNGVRAALQLLTENSEAQEHVRQKQGGIKFRLIHNKH